MKSWKAPLVIGFLMTFVILLPLANFADGDPNIYYGKVVGTEGKMIRVRADDGRVSVFWWGSRTHLDPRLPSIGDRVKIEYVKDKLFRNAATRVTVLSK